MISAANRVITIAKTELENSGNEAYKTELAAIIKKAEEGKLTYLSARFEELLF